MEKKDLVQHYSEKWNRTLNETLERIKSYNLEVKPNQNDKNHIIDVTPVESSNGLKIRIEFDEKNGRYHNYKYGIYYGVWSENKDHLHKLNLSDIWTKYSERVFKDEKVNQKNVFLKGDIGCSEDNDKWAFWIRVDEKFELVDIAEHIYALAQSVWDLSV